MTFATRCQLCKFWRPTGSSDGLSPAGTGRQQGQRRVDKHYTSQYLSRESALLSQWESMVLGRAPHTCQSLPLNSLSKGAQATKRPVGLICRRTVRQMSMCLSASAQRGNF